MPKKVLNGVVIKNSSDKTISVLVERKVMHLKYGKTIKRSKKYQVHDEKNIAQIGDKVSIIENIPISKTKRWILLENKKSEF